MTRERVVLGAGLLCTLLAARPAPGQDRFEIQVYNSEVATPLRPGIEVHVNTTTLRPGTTDAEADLGMRAPLRLTFEPHFGLTRWAEVGMYLQTAVLPGGDYDYAGVKLRLKLALPRRLLGGTLGLALNQEISVMPSRYGGSRYGWELRPIVDFRWRWLYLAFNPMVDTELEGREAGRPAFEPAGRVMVQPVDWLAVGAEYYGGLGPFAQVLPLDRQTHWLLAAIEIERVRGPLEFGINLAVGRGLAGPEEWIVKAILEMDIIR